MPIEAAALIGRIGIEGERQSTAALSRFGDLVDRAGQRVEQSGQRMGRSLNAVTLAFSTFAGGAMLSAFSAATSAATDFFAGGFADARGAVQLMKQTETTIASMGNVAGFSGEQIADMASSLSDAAGASLFGDDQIQAAQNFLLTFSNIRGEVFEQATLMAADMAQALGTEPQAQAMALGKALNDPAKGLSALTRVGVSFTQQQIDQVKAMQAAGDIAGAQAIILEELGRQFGGSAQAAATAAGPWEQFQGILGETAESIASKFLPLWDQLGAALVRPETQAAISSFVDGLVNGVGGAIQWFTGTGIPLIQAAMPTVQAVFVALRDAVITFTQALSGNWTNSEEITLFHTIVGNLGLVVREVFGWLTDTAMPALQTAFTAAWPIIQAAVAGFADWFTATVWPALQSAFAWLSTTALPAVQTAFETVWPIVQNAIAVWFDWWMATVYPAITASFSWLADTALPALISAFEVAWPLIKNAVSGTYIFLSEIVWPWLQTAFDWVTGTGLPALQSAWDTAWPIIKTAVETTYTFLSGTVWPWLQEAFTTLQTWVQTARDTWSSSWDTIQSTTSTTIDTVKGFFSDLATTAQEKIDETVGFFSALPGRIGAAVGDLSGTLVSAGADLIAGLIAGMGNIASLVRDKITAGISGGIAGVKAFFGIKSPSTYTYEQIGVPLAQGIVNGLGDALSGFAPLGGKRIDQLMDSVAGSNTYRKGYTKGKQVGESVAAGIEDGITTGTFKQKLGQGERAVNGDPSKFGTGASYGHSDPVPKSLIPDGAAVQEDLARNFTDPVATAIAETTDLWTRFGTDVQESTEYTWTYVGQVITETADVTQRHLYEFSLLALQHIKNVMNGLDALNTKISNTNRVNVPVPSTPSTPASSSGQGSTFNSSTNNSFQVNLHMNGDISRESGRQAAIGFTEELRARGYS